jgi:group I intron endonuclease
MPCGIYKILNSKNGKFYIGSASDIKRSWRQHRFELIHNTHDNRHLQYSWNRYGESSFEFIILEECERDELVNREQFYFDTQHPDYNISKFAQSSLGVKRTPEQIEKQRQKMIGRKLTDEHRRKVGLASLGRKHSEDAILKIKEYHNRPEVKERIRLVHLGTKKSPETIQRMRVAQSNRSEETRKKLSIANSGKKRTPEEIRKRNETRRRNNGGFWNKPKIAD